MTVVNLGDPRMRAAFITAAATLIRDATSIDTDHARGLAIRLAVQLERSVGVAAPDPEAVALRRLLHDAERLIDDHQLDATTWRHAARPWLDMGEGA